MSTDYLAARDPEVAAREQRGEVLRRVEAAQDELAEALAALRALDACEERRVRWARPEVAPQTMTLREAARALGVGMTTMNKLVQSGELPSFFVASRRKVRIDAVERYLEHCTALAQEAS